MLPKCVVEPISLELYHNGIIKFLSEPRKLASGLKSRIYLDMEKVPGDKIFCKNFQEQLSEWLNSNPNISGRLIYPIPFGGKPWLNIVKSCFPNQSKELILEKEQIERFSRGEAVELTVEQRGVINGAAGQEVEVIVIEDVFTTGGSIAKNTKFLKSVLLNPRKAVAVIDRQRPRDREFLDYGLEVFSFLTITDVLAPLVNIPNILPREENQIEKEELSLIQKGGV